MSEQADAMLQLPSSYNFKRETTGNYRQNGIDSNRFQMWVKNDMYRSTYAQNHSPVLHPSPRIPSSLAQATSPATVASSPTTGLRVCTARPMPTRPRTPYAAPPSTTPAAASPPPASTWTAMPSSTSPRTPPATSTARLSSKGPIPDGL